MSASLSPETISIIESTVPVLQQQGVAITTRMYERLFVDPEMKALFDEAAQKILPPKSNTLRPMHSGCAHPLRPPVRL